MNRVARADVVDSSDIGFVVGANSGCRQAGLLFNNSEIRSRIYCVRIAELSSPEGPERRICGYMLIAQAIGKLKMRLGV